MTANRDTPPILLGGGGHAKVIFDVLRAQGVIPGAYVALKASPWLDEAGVARLPETQLDAVLPSRPRLILGFVGLTCRDLEKRYGQMRDYMKKGAVFPLVMHPSAIISPSAKLSPGAQLMPGVIVNSHAIIGEGAVLNTGAIVEHDANIGAGSHVAPGATVLGGAQVGRGTYIGSRAVVIQNANVPDNLFIKATTAYK